MPIWASRARIFAIACSLCPARQRPPAWRFAQAVRALDRGVLQTNEKARAREYPGQSSRTPPAVQEQSASATGEFRSRGGSLVNGTVLSPNRCRYISTSL